MLAQADADVRESLNRKNNADPLAGEQTWPTEQVLSMPSQPELQPAPTVDPQEPWLHRRRSYCTSVPSDLDQSGKHFSRI